MPSLTSYFHFPEMIIRRHTQADIEPAVTMINRAYTYQDAIKGEPRITAQKLRDRARSTEFYVAHHAGILAACVYLESRPPVMHFGLLPVSEQFRGRRLAPAILAAIETYSLALSCRTLELDYMSAAPWLKAYYERHGSTETGQVTSWGKIDLIRMSKPIAQQKTSL